MGSSKTGQYSIEDLTFARIAKAIAHPARALIVRHLASSGLATNAQIMKLTGLTDGTIAQHLRDLTYSGMLSEVYVGNKHYYKLSADAENAVTSLRNLFTGKMGVPVLPGNFPR